MSASIRDREFAKGLIDQAIRRALATLGRKPRRAFASLLVSVQGRSDLLRPSRAVGRREGIGLDPILRGLLTLNEDRRDWLRPVEDWTPNGSAPVPIFSSLAHHLFADYPVPPVLLSAWFEEEASGTAWRHRRWFRHVGRGGSLRTAGLPIALTRRMIGEFVQAPPGLPIDYALRWAQVRGLGGSDELARAVAATRLGREFDHDAFWITALHFFLNHPRLDLARIDAIVEFLHDRKFERRRILIGEDTEVSLDPPQPGLSLKGWSVSSLLRRVEDWQARRAEESRPKRVLMRWDHSAIGEFLAPDGSGRMWTIRELLDSDALAAEGRAMDHCVATYTAACAKRESTIWSIGLEGPDGRERQATVEVDPASRGVVQAKAQANEEPDAASLAILKRWAEREALTLET